MEENKKYHEVFIPMPDVYQAGGPEIFRRFEGKNGKKNLIVFPFTFLENLDKLKESSYGVEKTLDFLSEQSKDQGNIITKKEGEYFIRRISDGIDIGYIENKLFSGDSFSVSKLEETTRKFWESESKRHKLLTLNKALLIKLSARGMNVETPEYLEVDEEIVFEGIITGNDELLSKLYETGGKVPLSVAEEILNRKTKGLYNNQFIRFVYDQGEIYARVTMDLIGNKSGTRIIGTENGRVELIQEEENNKKLKIGCHYQDNILGIKPIGMEQYLAFQYGLLNPDVRLFFLCGRAGSGKTILSYATAIDSVLIYPKEIRDKRYGENSKKEGTFSQVCLLKPIDIIGGKRREVGFLPGDLFEKLRPHLEAYKDAHKISSLSDEIAFEELLLHSRVKNEFGEPRTLTKERNINSNAHLPVAEVIQVIHSGFARGRSIENRILLIDEAQNFEPYELKTIIERTAEGSKCIVMGDPFQLDNPNCSLKINGLTSAIKQYLGKPYASLMYLSKSRRSQMSEDADSWKVFPT